MTIAKQTVTEKIASYLPHGISIADLVSWVEDAIWFDEIVEFIVRVDQYAGRWEREIPRFKCVQRAKI